MLNKSFIIPLKVVLKQMMIESNIVTFLLHMWCEFKLFLVIRFSWHFIQVTKTIVHLHHMISIVLSPNYSILLLLSHLLLAFHGLFLFFISCQFLLRELSSLFQSGLFFGFLLLCLSLLVLLLHDFHTFFGCTLDMMSVGKPTIGGMQASNNFFFLVPGEFIVDFFEACISFLFHYSLDFVMAVTFIVEPFTLNFLLFSHFGIDLELDLLALEMGHWGARIGR
mmetsp:Transcript_25882/g.22823  ORF Transcript_25882/g.22823 Transcript_25882/m.22823 type:complete len:223 (-) Transcript_25882:41-709(-)